MSGPFRFSLREMLLLVVIVGLAAALVHFFWAEEQPVYLHVLGTNVNESHDLARPKDSPLSSDGRPWMRVATISIYHDQPFSVFMPNDRSPAIELQGRLRRTARKYEGQARFFLDDNNLTYDIEVKELRLEQLVYIDNYYYCYILSESEDPYVVLQKALKPVSK